MRASDILVEMAFDKKVAEAKIRAKEETINLHFIKLLAFDAQDGTKAFWRKEIFAETRFLSGISMRTGKRVRHVTAEMYFALLYAEPFESNEVPYTEALISVAETKAEQAGTPLQRNQREAADIAVIVKKIHQALCQLLETGNGGQELLATVGSE